MAAKVSIEVSVDDKGVVTGLENVRGGIKKVGEEGNLVFTELTEKQAMARKETEALAGSMNTAVVPSLKNARGEAALLGEEIGVKLPRHVRNFIAESSLLAPIMAAAFSATAVIFIGQVFLENTDRIKNMAASLGGFTDGLRAMEQAAKDANRELFTTFSDNKLGMQFLNAQNQKMVGLQAEHDAIEAKLDNHSFTSMSFAESRIGLSLRLKDVTEQLAAAEQLRLQMIVKYQNNTVDEINQAKEKTKALHAQKEAIDQLTPALERLSNSHSLAGSAGSDKILIEETQRIAELKALGATDEQARSAAEKEADDRLLALRTQYHDKLRSIEDQAAQSGLSARDKSIEQEHERVDAALADFNREFGALEDLDKNKIAAQKDLETQLYAIHKVGSEERIKIDQDEAQKAADAAKRAADEAQKTSEKLIKEHQQAVEKMGSELQSLFDDITSGKIGQRLLKNFEKLVFQMVAQWLMGMNQMQSGIGGLFSALLGIGGGGAKNGTGGFSLGSLFGLGGSSGGGIGSNGFAGTGVNGQFLSQYGGTAQGAQQAQANQGAGGAAGGLGAADMLAFGIGGFALSFALNSILTPEPSKAMIAAQTLQSDQATAGSLQSVLQDFKDDKISYGEAARKIGVQAEMSHSKELYFNPGALPGLDASFKALMDQLNDIKLDKDRALNPGYGHGAATFHDGGFTGNAGFSLRSNEIHAILRDDEFVVNPQATRMHRGTLEKMNRGENPSGHTFIIQALDGADVESWLRRGGAEKIARGTGMWAREGGAA